MNRNGVDVPLRNGEPAVRIAHGCAAVPALAAQGLRDKRKLVGLEARHADALEEIFQFRIGEHALIEAVHGGSDCRLAANALIETGFACWLAHGSPPCDMQFRLMRRKAGYAGLLEERSTRTAHCLKLGSREIGSNALCVI